MLYTLCIYLTVYQYILFESVYHLFTSVFRYANNIQ